ncbi:ubiquitin C-terminal hydrolase [Patellaria atrata CBS 101060]|uniref:Ubiquitin carboxyl-terminal hydrolase n=1 Tax=Patellaria atrata CBS 101060 TaxID=1346257 RepID=A0A9P4VUZ7_9PEZI|nr:ubiquitin C-terminal hydrolase [Patellaria atrata CBS 101060]
MADPTPKSPRESIADYPDYPNKRKHFIPLENNPEVFSHLIQCLGISPSLGFHDIYSIDDPSLLSFIPRPAYALLFICPSEVYYRARANEPQFPDYNGSGSDEPVVWYKQTIGNACGLIGLLHGISNGKARNFITPGSDIDTLIKDAILLKPQPRADLLYNSSTLESAHASAAVRGDTVAPDAEPSPELHYICFAKGADGHLYELEGGWNGPIDRGQLEEHEDMLSERALSLGVKLLMEKAGGNLNFSCVALAPSFDS